MWGKSRKKLENGEKASGASERKVPDVGLSSSHAFVHYLGTGGSGTNRLHRSLQCDPWSRRPSTNTMVSNVLKVQVSLFASSEVMVHS